MNKKQDRTQVKVHFAGLSALLQSINPLQGKYIELEDMKSILVRTPQKDREICQKIFHDYIFRSKSFKLPVSTFTEMYKSFNRKPSLKSTHRRTSSAKENYIKRSLRKLSKEREFIQYDSNFMEEIKLNYGNLKPKRAATPALKSKPRRQKLNRSFKDLYQNTEQLIEIRRNHLIYS